LVCGGVRWCAVVCGGVRWCALGCGGVRWCAVVCGGVRGCAGVCGAEQWCAVLSRGVRWCAAVTDCARVCALMVRRGVAPHVLLQQVDRRCAWAGWQLGARCKSFGRMHLTRCEGTTRHSMAQRLAGAAPARSRHIPRFAPSVDFPLLPTHTYSLSLPKLASARPAVARWGFAGVSLWTPRRRWTGSFSSATARAS
jgi:hypothetical protein